ncbi:MAG TPA: hypothetical protein VFV02_17020, partial [Acidimicrobiales bacterium]|nr:hypothetical protein [Acidimicrobiales bacterium]
MTLLTTAVLERAGGGHGFSGGGGGGGGSFGGGGGGGFFLFGGGGGGGAGAGFGVFILILVVLFIVFAVIRPRMNRRIGGRGGSFEPPVDSGLGAPVSPPVTEWSHADQPAISSIRGDLFPGTADNAMHPESAADGL